MAKPLSRVRPTDAPAEAVERVARTRGVDPQPGDIIVTRESAGRLSTVTPSTWQYSLRFVDGRHLGAAPRYLSRYDAAASEAERLASDRKVRLFYSEDGNPLLLMDYRTNRP